MNVQDKLIDHLSRLWMSRPDRETMVDMLQALDTRYLLSGKMANEPGVAKILEQMIGRLANSFKKISDIRNKKILDIACGSNTSRLPASLYINTPFGERSFGSS